MWYIHTIKYYLARKRNEVLIHDTNMDESHKLYADLKKTDTRDYVLHTIIYTK